MLSFIQLILFITACYLLGKYTVDGLTWLIGKAIDLAVGVRRE